MNDRSPVLRSRRAWLPWPAPALGWLLLATIATPLAAGERVPFAARGGLEIASEAALTWSTDATLIYVENDEAIDERGAAPRWGYLFYSPASRKARGYSVRNGKILVAENLEMRFEAPPLAADWIDSGAALEAAEEKVGRAFRRNHQGQLSTMLLIRGAFNEGDPDRTTWTLVYTSPTAPSLFVVVDAVDRKVRRTWRG
ncbi:MAG TPA: hypothetical protein VEY91_13925 [Candidatus Limnocylindria bacterium]|nr:hypothetical protein [Candidatus Limnocylindria bacterium]